MFEHVYRKFETDVTETIAPTEERPEAEQVDFSTVLKKVNTAAMKSALLFRKGVKD